jgi:hypothetical protein
LSTSVIFAFCREPVKQKIGSKEIAEGAPEITVAGQEIAAGRLAMDAAIGA